MVSYPQIIMVLEHTLNKVLLGQTESHYFKCQTFVLEYVCTVNITNGKSMRLCANYQFIKTNSKLSSKC